MSDNNNNDNNTTSVEAGYQVSVHYRGTLDDGTEFDNSYDRGETLTFEVGAGQMISGFDNAIVGMQIGEVKEVSLTSAEAYGAVRPEAIKEVAKNLFPEDFLFAEGMTVQGTDENNNPVRGTILSESEESVTMDFNHPMAGHNLNFKIELVDAWNAGSGNN